MIVTNQNRAPVILFLILALCACCLPAGVALPSYSFRGSVVGFSEIDNTVTVLVTHTWGCEYGNETMTCTWRQITPKVLTGTAPTSEVFDRIRTGSPVMAASIGRQGERWTGIGILTPSYSIEPLHATDLYGEPGLLPAPLAAGYALAITTQPDCGNCSGTVCQAQTADVAISHGIGEVWNGTLLPGKETVYEDPLEGSGISVKFVSGQASSNPCASMPPGISGIQPVSVFIVHVEQPGTGPGPTISPAGTGSLLVNSIPPGASILLDGVAKGVTPRTISGVQPGVYTLVLEKEGYADYEKNVTVSAGRTTMVTGTLQPLYGSLRIQSSPSGATVLVKGNLAGVTPLVVNGLVPGEYAISLSKTGYQTANRTATVTAGQEKLLFVTLSSKKDGSEKIDAFILALEKEGFTVQQGKFEKFDVLAMYDAHIISSCFGNNPSTPYLAYKLPGYPGLAQGGRVTDAIIHPENKGLWLDYFMKPDEAIVFVGTTPPESKYFSYRSYIGTRWYPERNTFGRIFASLGDAINNVRINTGSSPGQAGSNPYEKPVMIITTADRDTNEQVRKAAIRAGYSTGMMNDDIIPSGLIRMGLPNTSDTITFVHRVAFFANKTRGGEYLNSTPGYVFRLTPNTSHTPQPYNVPPLIVRGTGDTRELNLMKDLDALREAIIDRYGDGMVISENKTGLGGFEGYDAIQQDIDALGDNRDTIYLRNGDYLLSDNDFIIVYGVNHQAIGKVLYTNVALYGVEAFNGVVAVSNADYAGSASSYLPGNEHANLLYAWKFARHCNGEKGCTEVPSCCGALGIPEDVPVFIGIRAYVEPGTGIGPAWSEILYDQAIHFGPK
jgi:hypothetical protein